MVNKRSFVQGLLIAGLALATLVGGVLAPQSALAATLYITEFANGMSQVGSTSPQVLPTPPVATQAISISGSSALSAAFNAGTHAVQLQCDTGCSIAFGASPTATTSTTLLSANQAQNFVVIPGQKVAVITNASGGTGGTAVNLVDVGGAAITLGQTTMAASLPVTLASNQSTITTQMAGWSFQNITTSTTTTVKSGAGVLHLVNVNALGTVASTTTVYDNTAGSGTKIATINSLTLSGPFQYDIAFSTGLTLVTTGTQAPDITVSYR